MSKPAKLYYFDKHYKQYHVKLYIGGRYFHVGRFDTEGEAKVRREEALKRLITSEVEAI